MSARWSCFHNGGAAIHGEGSGKSRNQCGPTLWSLVIHFGGNEILTVGAVCLGVSQADSQRAVSKSRRRRFVRACEGCEHNLCALASASCVRVRVRVSERSKFCDMAGFFRPRPVLLSFLSLPPPPPPSLSLSLSLYIYIYIYIMP